MAGKCPLAGECMEHGCAWYVLVQGQHPQTGAAVDRWDCAVAWLPLLLIENTKENRAAAVTLTQQHELARQSLRSSALGAPTRELLRAIDVTEEQH
jgi:hypothetical protein